jgi:hypothetical protein
MQIGKEGVWAFVLPGCFVRDRDSSTTFGSRRLELS